MNKKKFNNIAKNVINLEIKALQKLKKNINNFKKNFKYWKKFKWIYFNYRFVKFKLQKSKI